MCGIIGFTGNVPAKDIIINGLEQLEYRGYDSAGIALLADGEITLRKRTGKVAELKKLCNSEELNATCGIGHTRWATHGGVTDTNAHPHRCGKVVLIHNGIIENYRELIVEYGLQDTIVSETDSEVVAALIDKFYEDDPYRAIKHVVKILSGAFALCIMFVPSFTRVVRMSTLQYKDTEFVRYYRTFGASHFRIVFVHILPNVVPMLLSSVIIGLSNAILAESSMSYLGLGIQPPAPSWGWMLNEAQSTVFRSPWYALSTGLMIVFTIAGFNFIGEGLRKNLR